MPKGRQGKGHGNRDSAVAKKKDRAVKEALRKERKSGACLDPADPDFRSFTNQLQAQGLKLVDVPGDGNCLFRALSDQLRDGHSRHHGVRKAVVEYMRTHKEEFAPFVEDNMSFEDHVSTLSKDGEYAGNDAIVAFARCYAVDVVIHQLNAPKWEVLASRAPGGRCWPQELLEGGAGLKSSWREVLASRAPGGRCWPQELLEGGAGLKSSWREVLASRAPGGRTLHIAYLNGEHYCSVCTIIPLQALPSVASTELSGAQTRPPSATRGPAMQQVIDCTGCQDLAMVEQCLQENAYDPDLAIVELLQLMDLSEGVLGQSKLVDEDEAAPKLSLGVAAAHTRSGEHRHPIKQQPKPPPQSQRHVSNRERKQQAKAARKERRVEEQRTQKDKSEEYNPVGAMAI